MNLEKAYTYGDVNLIPQASTVESRKECNTSVNFLGVELEVPLVPANMSAIAGQCMLETMDSLGSIGIMHRFKQWKYELKYMTSIWHNHALNINYAASVGVNNTEKDLEFLMSLPVLPKFVVIDVAHGHHKKVEDAIRKIKETVEDLPVVAGNVATGTGALYLAGCGADAIKVGIGNGSLCETRIRTGVGIPQFSALLNVKSALVNADMEDVLIIADGGVETPGDVAKAIGAGASIVMSGNFFSGTKETPLPLLKSGNWANPTLYKQYAGSASFLAKTENGETPQNIEGNAKLIPYKGSCKRIITEVKQGLQSSMSYLGARNLQEFYNRAYFVKVTQNGIREASPYLLG